MAMLEGIKLNLGGREFVVPPLNLKALRILGPTLAGITKATRSGDFASLVAKENLDAMVDVIHAGISRNYPDLTREDLEDLVDLSNLQDAFMAVCAESGLKQVPAGEGKAPRRR